MVAHRDSLPKTPCSLNKCNSRLLVPSTSRNLPIWKTSWCPNIIHISHALFTVMAYNVLCSRQPYLYFVPAEPKSCPQQHDQLHRIDVSRGEFLGCSKVGWVQFLLHRVTPNLHTIYNHVVLLHMIVFSCLWGIRVLICACGFPKYAHCGYKFLNEYNI